MILLPTNGIKRGLRVPSEGRSESDAGSVHGPDDAIKVNDRAYGAGLGRGLEGPEIRDHGMLQPDRATIRVGSVHRGDPAADTDLSPHVDRSEGGCITGLKLGCGISIVHGPSPASAEDREEDGQPGHEEEEGCRS